MELDSKIVCPIFSLPSELLLQICKELPIKDLSTLSLADDRFRVLLERFKTTVNNISGVLEFWRVAKRNRDIFRLQQRLRIKHAWLLPQLKMIYELVGPGVKSLEFKYCRIKNRTDTEVPPTVQRLSFQNCQLMMGSQIRQFGPLAFQDRGGSPLEIELDMCRFHRRGPTPVSYVVYSFRKLGWEIVPEEVRDEGNVRRPQTFVASPPPNAGGGGGEALWNAHFCKKLTLSSMPNSKSVMMTMELNNRFYGF